MFPDTLQQAWQAESSQTRVTVDADLLLKEVQRNQRDFRATILRRDVLEVGVGLVLLPVWFYLGARNALPWTWWLGVPAILWVVGFFLVDRMRYPQTPSDPGEPLLNCVKKSLSQVEHQIWLLRNVFWWYLLPFTIAISSFFAHVAWQLAIETNDWLEAIVFATILFVFLFALYYFIYWLNQLAVRKQLEPRRQELLALLASLGDETPSELAPTTSSESTKSSGKLRRWLFVASVCVGALVVIALASGIYDSSYDGPPRSSGPEGNSLASLITDLRREKDLVGLAAMVMVDGEVTAVAAHGERKIGSGVPIELGDRWHLGGITKSITATMIARLVESGQMEWSDTVSAIFPDASIHEDWKPVTLKQLLTDTAGAPANFPKEVLRNRPPLGPECTQARREAVLGVIAQKPDYSPGEKYVYSNVGYTIVGAMAEKVTGETWEDLVKREVFEPLELTETGFGPPKGSSRSLEQPRGHRIRFSRKIAVDDTTDNTPIMGPSGSIHMTLNDLCTFAAEHMRGNLGTGTLLSTETYELLHAREFGPYSCGWIRWMSLGKELPYTVYWHNGSNTMWYALVMFIPEKNMVIAVTSNDGDFESAELAAWEIVKTIAKQFPGDSGAKPINSSASVE